MPNVAVSRARRNTRTSLRDEDEDYSPSVQYTAYKRVDTGGVGGGGGGDVDDDNWAVGIAKSFRIWSPMGSMGSKLNWLLLAFPVSIASDLAGWPKSVTFSLSLASIIPMAAILGAATDEVAMRTSQTIGGLLNATFGNAVELIVSILALRAGLLDVVKFSLLGSILSNMLLVLGSAFLLGGTKYKTQQFNATAAGTNGSLLLLVILTMALPAVFVYGRGDEAVIEADVLALSRISALFLMAIYISFLVFQLYTHKDLFEDEEEDEDEPSMSLAGALTNLVVVTLLVSYEADLVVASLEAVSASWGVPNIFLSVCLLPIAGNAAEHATALLTAYHDKMDLAIGVVVGSSTQIAVFVVPVCVLVGWIIGQPLTLFFDVFLTVCLFVSVLIVNVVLQDGESNWLEGILLIFAYAILAVSLLYYPDNSV